MFGKIWEKIIINGAEHSTSAEPLESYFNKIRTKPFEDWLNAACKRGYVGTWKIFENKLILTKIEPYGDADKAINLKMIFPEKEEVFANWFHGEIKVYSGEYLLPFKDYTDEPLFENEMVFTFKDGILTNKLIFKHSMKKDDDLDFMKNDYSIEIIDAYTSKT